MASNGFRRGTQRNKPHSLGPCCVCGTTAGVNVVLLLAQKSPTPGTGWGCLQCGLASDGAIAVACEPCRTQVEAGVAKVQYVCAAYPSQEGRVPIAQVTGTHEHDLSKHVDEEGGW